MSYPRLKDLREDKDLSQADVANKINTSQSYYAQYENGKRPIPFERVIELADFYNVSLDYIAGRSKNKQDTTKDSTTAALIQKINTLSDKQRKAVLQCIEALTEENKKKLQLPPGVELVKPKK